MTFSYIAGLLQLIGGIILAVGYIPQITKTLRTKHVEDFNPMYYRLVFLGIVLMEIYAIDLIVEAHAGYMFFITNTISTILSGTMFYLTEKYRSK
jgi:MtN3 and saliva related transmembrane protein